MRTHGGHKQIHIVANGYGTVPAALAALSYDEVAQVTLKRPPTSYLDIASSDVYGWPLSALPLDVLKHFDLPDVYRELKATKELRLIDPVGADGPNGSV